AVLEIDVLPGPGQDLGPHTPSRDVGDLDDRPNRVRQMREERLELLPLEKTFPGGRLLEERNVRFADDLLRDLSQAEGPLERGGLAVDGGVGRALVLPGAYIGLDPALVDVRDQRQAEMLAQVGERLLRSPQ